MIMAGVGVGMALTSPDEEGEMATNALVVLQVISIVIVMTMFDHYVKVDDDADVPKISR